MIVADANVLIAFYLPVTDSETVASLFKKDPEWIVPKLWRSEFRNVLATFMRRELLDFDTAIEVQTAAETLLAGNEFELPSLDILPCARDSGCSAYDCEYIALARFLGVKLATLDRRVLKAWPELALEPQQLLA